jgi:hypothetical protein
MTIKLIARRNEIRIAEVEAMCTPKTISTVARHILQMNNFGVCEERAEIIKKYMWKSTMIITGADAQNLHNQLITLFSQ